jgi:hypothetical protein
MSCVCVYGMCAADVLSRRLYVCVRLQGGRAGAYGTGAGRICAVLGFSCCSCLYIVEALPQGRPWVV